MSGTEPPAKETQHDTKPRKKKKWHENWVVNRSYDWGKDTNKA